MKKCHAWIVYTLLGYGGAGIFEGNAVEAQPAQAGMSLPRIVERWADGRVWERTVTNVVNDRVIVRTNRWTDLATGMHYWDQNHWKVSRIDISIVQDGAEASQGAHKVHFAGNINTVGAITVTSRDGEVLQSHVAALGYTDTATGQSVLLGQIQDSVGQLVPLNKVVYSDAFAGLKADIRYTYMRDGFEQDVILRENPPGPEQYGFDPKTTVLEIWTEFVQSPEPSKTVRDRDGLSDELLNFGRLRMKQGGAFAIDAAPDGPTIPVYKNWVQQGNRRFLVEMVPHQQILSELQKLPGAQAALPAKKGMRQALLQNINPRRADRPQPVRMALNNEKLLRGPGLVMDYPLYEGDYADLTFQADTTYLLSGSINCYGTTTFEGGAIIKFATTNDYEVTLQTWSNVVFKTDRYRPAVFTSMNDRTVGEDFYIPGTSTNYHCAVSSSQSDQEFKHLRVSFANYGLHAYSMRVHDAQFTHCVNAFETDGQSITLDNVLVYDVTNVFNGYGYTGRVCNVTVDGCISLGTVVVNYPSNCYAALTNCLLVNVGTNGGINLSTNYTVTTTNNIFQTVGAGAHYLADPSPYRDAGTTNVPATLLADLKRTTTYPPLVIAPAGGFYGVSQTWFPRSGWDTDIPDLGYHYDPLDYAVNFLYLTNATIQADPGTAIALFNTTNAYGFGLAVGSDGKFQFNGHADAKVTVTHYATVQEMANTNWNRAMGALIETTDPPSASSEFRSRFTDYTVLANGPWMFNWPSETMAWRFIDCQFHGGIIKDPAAPFFFTNCLFNRCDLDFEATADITNYFYNCTFNGGAFYAPLEWDTNHVRMYDSLFVDATISGPSELVSSHIGYYNSGRLTPTNTSDVILTNSAFQTGTLGYFYIASNVLVNAGSRYASNAGLYHYTMLTNNVKEINTTVDIGFHYVATDANGTPLDSDGDGLPDYWEDTNGNGSVEITETDWQYWDTDHDGVGDGEEVLQGRNPLGGTLADTNNLINLRVFTPLK